MRSEPSDWPRRIICLTAETTELVFALGLESRLVGVSGYCVRPKEARLKEKVAAFTSIRMDKIRSLKPDLILGFSDLQKEIARELIGEGFNVFITNQRSLDDVGDMVLAVGRVLGVPARAEEIRDQFFREIDELALAVNPGEPGFSRPRIYFEEWDQPMISGIRWVSDLIERLGGQDIFRKESLEANAGNRIRKPEEVIQANPQIMIASWCGKKVQTEKIFLRPGWEKIEAIQTKQVYEIKSPDILAPGPSLIHGARRLAGILKTWQAARGSAMIP